MGILTIRYDRNTPDEQAQIDGIRRALDKIFTSQHVRIVICINRDRSENDGKEGPDFGRLQVTIDDPALPYFHMLYIITQNRLLRRRIVSIEDELLDEPPY